MWLVGRIYHGKSILQVSNQGKSKLDHAKERVNYRLNQGKSKLDHAKVRAN